jgi:hypothetical protein
LALGCTHSSSARPSAAGAPTSPASSVAAQPAPPHATACPRVERAARIFTGFADDAQDVDLVLALDVVVPIQEALGVVFCTPAQQACRPATLMRIELVDSIPTAALLRLGLGSGPTRRELELRLLWSAGAWKPEAASLASYLTSCRTAATAASRTDDAHDE